MVTAAKGTDKTRRAEPEAAMSMARLKKSLYGFISLSGTGGLTQRLQSGWERRGDSFEFRLRGI